MFERETPHIWRLKVPFDNLTTSVFLIETDEGHVLFDCATTEEDVENHIMPAIAEAGVEQGNIKWLFCSHSHADHAGGMPGILRRMPHIRTADDLPKCLRAIPLPGHTAECRGLMDLRTRTLLSGDALQFCGVGRFGCGVQEVKAYLDTMKRIRMENPSCLLASHEYVPCGNRADGAQQVQQWLEVCRAYIGELENQARDCVCAGMSSAGEITRAFVHSHPQLPPVPEATFRSILKELLKTEE